MKIGCVVLAGGLATRMGGGDKGLKMVAGQSILDRVLETVHPQVADIVLNANGDPVRFQSFGLKVVADTVPDHPGPLAGILAGMEAMADCDYLLSVPTDTPFLPDDLVARLSQPILTGEAQVTIARSGGFDHPVVGLWPLSLKADLQHALVKDDIRKMKRWISQYKYTAVEWATDPQDPFFNANRPEDLAEINQ